MPTAISTLEHLADLKTLVTQHSTRSVEFIIEDDLETWATAHGMSDGRDPNGRALTRHRDGMKMIALRSTYTDAQVQATSSTLFVCGWVGQSEEVKRPVQFLRFIVLHELAHLEHDWGQEHEQACNEWAFAKLGWVDA